MEILNSIPADIDRLFELYDAATLYQKTVGGLAWKGFDREPVLKEIEAGDQWKIMIDGQIAAVFLIAWSDPLIWKEKDQEDAIYIHRIAIDPLFRGQHFVKHIITWSKAYALEHGRSFLRMDTGAGNERLNNYYISCGFSYLGIVPIGDAGDLPAHYHNRSFSLFEMAI